MLHLSDARELDSLGLPPALLKQAKQQLAPQIPDIGDLAKLTDAELWSRVEAEQANIRRAEKEIAERGLYVTAARYRSGKFLNELKPRCEKTFEKECKARRITSQRASEDRRIADLFASEAEAGKVPIHRALAMIKRSDASYGPYENCFACPQWLAPPRTTRCKRMALWKICIWRRESGWAQNHNVPDLLSMQPVLLHSTC